MLEKLIIMITGATDGIGLHTAKKLANSVDVLILHGRNEERLKNSKEEIKNVSNNPDLKILTVLGDLASLQDIREIARQVRDQVPHISCLINNAGVFLPEYKQTKDGLEQTFAVNVVAPYLLTNLLKDLVVKSENPRLINTSSISQSSEVPTEFQLNERNYNGHTAYSQSKLFDRMITVGQVKSLPGVTCLTLDPGTVNTKMLLEGWGACGISIEDADDTYWLATNKAIEVSCSGNYYVHRRLSTGHSFTEQDITRLTQYLDQIIQTQ